jgi:hypothetical protein
MENVLASFLTEGGKKTISFVGLEKVRLCNHSGIDLKAGCGD